MNVPDRNGAAQHCASALLLAWLGALGAGCAAWPDAVETALSGAGANRPELEKVLWHYRDRGAGRKLEAAEFLIANMPGHGFALVAFFDEDGEEVPFEALEYANYKEARAAFDALEKEHGTLHYARKRFDADLEHISADFLIENIDLAFQAWREKPWARKLGFEAFCETVLPYRGSNEPLGSTRAACMAPFADLSQRMKNPSDPREAAHAILGVVGSWMGFSELYYLHPTDQSFSQMRARRLGRCEDITNLQMYAMRANAVAAASDYTPFWADRDNNHAWQVILDESGRGKAGLSNRAAKIYRKTFAIQRASLGAIREEGEEVPRWLSGRNYEDVTAQYMETSDVTVRLSEKAPAGARFAYLCVFNGGEWQAIHWGRLEGGRVTFTKMGRNIAYLPAYYADKKLQPAAPPFILTKKGAMRLLDGEPQGTLAIELRITKPAIPDADLKIERPQMVVAAGKRYELFAWEGGWRSLGERTAGEAPVAFEGVPAHRLLWLVAKGSRRLERIFTLEDGRQVWW